MNKNDIMSMTVLEIEELLQAMKEQKFRAKQIYEWIHSKGVLEYSGMTNLSKELRQKLFEETSLVKPKIIEKYISKKDKTTKYLIELEDSHIIESVLMRHKYGNTVCISSQIGCHMGCAFCASTIDGLIRNLTPGEMLAQIYLIQEDVGERVSGVVVMGSGEPLEKLDVTLRFIDMINDPKGQNIGQRHITVSTCGLVPKIYELADRELQITLAISLHASNDTMRRQTMPIANKYSIEEIIESCRYYIIKTNRRITFEYALIEGVNDHKDDAFELANILKGLLCHVNLIPVNEIKERDYKHSNSKSIENFARVLMGRGIETTIRKTLGSDINAACGQLRRSFIQDGGE
ncbi:MAG TPA: 23S rRNA (adenine(2503)-C(2))-methyltransferase RlmN [Epulopiscium sp.]|nr:23S rRNA (adenine(2503)-C(2))-methyltransferase RlmN [Candidatus Epulonipiscium sp.]